MTPRQVAGYAAASLVVLCFCLRVQGEKNSAVDQAPQTWGGTAQAQEPIRDFTIGDQLTDLPGVGPGVMIYHLQLKKGFRYHLQKTREKLVQIPAGTHVSLDWEPWIANHDEFPWYGDATDTENLEMMGAYARFVREITPDLRERQLTLSLYSVPALMQRGNWHAIRSDPSGERYRRWQGEQIKLIQQAEQAGLLPALRAVGGYVNVVVYPITGWDGSKPWHAQQLDKVLTRSADLFRKHQVPFRFLARSQTVDGKRLEPNMVEVYHQHRADWWGKADEDYGVVRGVLGQ